MDRGYEANEGDSARRIVYVKKGGKRVKRRVRNQEGTRSGFIKLFELIKKRKEERGEAGGGGGRGNDAASVGKTRKRQDDAAENAR